MAKYLTGLYGGATPETEAEQQAVMAAWTNWFGEIGPAIADPATRSVRRRRLGTAARSATSGRRALPATRSSKPTASTLRPSWRRAARAD